jgi:teichuronic acid biosynthesis glycosyltransferase TuaC
MRPSARVRTVIVTTSWPEGPGDPSGHFVAAEARALERAGHDVVVVTPRPGGAFGWPGVAARLRERPSRALEAGSWCVDARRRVARVAADEVVAHWAVPCAWPIASAARHAALDVVSHGGDVRLMLGLPPLLREAVVARVASRARTWRFVSADLRDDLARALDVRTRKLLDAIAVVRAAALEMPDVQSAVARLRSELAGARVAVSVGRLVAAKRVDRAIAHVAKTRCADALVVVGDGPERARLEALARAWGVDARFVGRLPRQDALAWIGAAEMVLHASEAEGLSTVLREAEALGTPVVRVNGATA